MGREKRGMAGEKRETRKYLSIVGQVVVDDKRDLMHV